MTPDTRGTVNVSISTRTIFLIFAVVAMVWISLHLATVLIVVFSAIVLATAIDGPVSWMQARRIPRPLGVLGVCALILLVVTGLTVMLIPIISSELQALQTDLPRYAESIQRLVRRVVPGNVTATHFNLAGLSQQVADHLQSIVVELTQLSLVAGRIVLLLFATLVMTCFIAVRPSMGTTLLQRFAPQSWHRRATAISSSIRMRIGDWARGQALMAMTFGTVMGLGLWLLGVPYAVSLGAIAAALEVVPYLGGAVILILSVPLALTVGPVQAGAVVVLYLILVNLETHIFAPIFFGKTVDLPPVAVFLALLIGVETAGIVGAILAIPTTVVVWAMVAELWPAEGPPTGEDPQLADLSRSASGPSGNPL